MSELVTEKLANWLTTPLGKAFQAEEDRVVTKVIANLFGYHLLVLGMESFASCVHGSMIRNRSLVHNSFSLGELPTIQGRIDKLPIASESVDVVYLPHCLEFSRNPHEILREVYRVLHSEGHAIITTFNPLGFWLPWKILYCMSQKAPWSGKFYNSIKVHDWLQLLGFDVFETHHYFYRPPINHQTILNACNFIDTLGRKLPIPFGASYLTLASKRVVTLTPVRPVWKEKKPVLAGDLAEPTTRG